MAAGTHDFFANLGHFQGIIICLYDNKSSLLQTPSDMSDKICASPGENSLSYFIFLSFILPVLNAQYS